MNEEEKNNNSGPEEPTSTTTEAILDTKTNNLISMADFKAGKVNPKPEHWPAAIPQEATPTVLTVSKKDPLERRILISSTYGDVLMDGYLGLSQTFLAVGDAKGQIKFALAPGVWLAATDVTDDPMYAEQTNGFIDPEPDVA